MTMTAAERRRKERERKAQQRANAREEGRPDLAVVNAAIVEAAAYVLTGVNIGLKVGEHASYVNMLQVGRVAIKILVVRLEYDLEHSKALVMQQLAPREEHRWPSRVPSWHHVLHPGLPPGVAGRARNRTRPRNDAKALPLLVQDMSLMLTLF